MHFIEKHGKILAFALCACACGPVLSTAYAYEKQPGWHGEGQDRYYVLESNRQEATGLTEIDGDLYYFNGDGEMQFGWQAGPTGVYYFGQDGTAVTGETEIQGQTYNFQEEGNLLQGWNEDNSSYYDERGFEVTNEWVDEGGNRYYFDKDGNYVTGWSKLDGNKYYFAQDGKMATGEVEIDGETYYLQADGAYVTGWNKVGNTSYYHGENGETITDTSETIDGDLYFFDETGKMLKSCEKDGYVIDKNGVATKKVVKKPEAPKPQTPVNNSNTTSNTTTQPSQNTTVNNTPTTNSTPSTPAQNNNAGYTGGYNQAPAQNNSYAGVNSSAIASAALAQVGRNQDCTMLVTNSLRAVGINYHGWPEGYLSLGQLTSNPVPGDIIVYSGHVAIYLGGGQAVHGGWNGNTTVVTSVSCSNALIGFVHVG